MAPISVTRPAESRNFGVEALRSMEGRLQELHDCEPLSIRRLYEVEIMLSRGGPSDGFVIYLDDENQAVKGHYWMADWGEYEEFSLSRKDVERIQDQFCIYL